MSLKYGDDMYQALYSLHSVYFYALVFLLTLTTGGLQDFLNRVRGTRRTIFD